MSRGPLTFKIEERMKQAETCEGWKELKIFNDSIRY